MREFAALYRALDETTRTNAKVGAMVEYFQAADHGDAAWAVFFLTGRRLPSAVNRNLLRAWVLEEARLPEWLFDECYNAVADLAETIARVLSDDSAAETTGTLVEWVEGRILPLKGMEEGAQRQVLLEAWRSLDAHGRFVFNKLITGAFRVGVSQELVVRALAQAFVLPREVVSHRMMGEWAPTAEFFGNLITKESKDTDVSRPYPFCLAHPILIPIESIGEPDEYLAEWKWDGVRAQLVRRAGQTFLWSRGEGLIQETFPDVAGIGSGLSDGTVLDGEVLAWEGERPRPFQDLQRRLGRKHPSAKIQAEVPCVLLAFDILELDGRDLRALPTVERRGLLEDLVAEAHHPRLLLSDAVPFARWPELAAKRERSAEQRAEGLMLKRKDAPYVTGRKTGVWWKWKVDPFSVDAVLVYAQRGSGKRASLYTDYTFALWEDDVLVPFAKAYSGLTDEEIREVDAFVRRHTRERFGPVRTVDPELVFEIAFEGIQLSTRHKSGVAVRFPRISRWRRDKKPAEADKLDAVKELLRERFT